MNRVCLMGLLICLSVVPPGVSAKQDQSVKLTIKAPIATVRFAAITTLQARGYRIQEMRLDPPSPRRRLTVELAYGDYCEPSRFFMVDIKGIGSQTMISVSCLGRVSSPLPPDLNDDGADTLKEIRMLSESFAGTAPPIVGADQPEVPETGTNWVFVSDAERLVQRAHPNAAVVPQCPECPAEPEPKTPSSAKDYLELAEHRLQHNRPDEAEAAIRKAIELDPSSADAHWELGKFYKSQSQFEQAVVELEKAAVLGPTASIYFDLSQAYYPLGKRPEGEGAYRKGVALLGIAAKEIERSVPSEFEQLAVELEKAAVLTPSLEIYHRLGYVYCTLGKLPEAEGAYQKALASPTIDTKDSERSDVELSIRMTRTLQSLIDRNRLAKNLSEQPLEGSWNRHAGEILRLDLPGHSTEERQAAKLQMEKALKSETYPLDIQGIVNSLGAKDMKDSYAGCWYNRWFVLWARHEGPDSLGSGCTIQQVTLISGELTDQGTVEGTWASESSGDHPEKCPKAGGGMTYKFTAERKQSSGTAPTPPSGTPSAKP